MNKRHRSAFLNVTVGEGTLLIFTQPKFLSGIPIHELLLTTAGLILGGMREHISQIFNVPDLHTCVFVSNSTSCSITNYGVNLPEVNQEKRSGWFDKTI